MKIEFLSSDDQRIFSFFNQNAHLIFHTPAYAKFISSAFSCRYLFAAAITGDEVKTILPFVEVKSSFFGNRVISTAYLEYGGFAGEKEGVAPILAALQEKYGESFDYLEIRGGMAEFDAVLSAVMVKKDLYKRFVLKLRDIPHHSVGLASELLVNNSEERKHIENSVFGTVQFSSGTLPAIVEFRKNIQKSKRKAVFKAKNAGVVVRAVPLEDLKNLYELYCQNMKQFGSPCYSFGYFESFYEHLVKKNLGKIYGSYIDGKLAAALLGVCYLDRVHIIIAISDSHKQKYRPNDAVHSEFIEWAIENKFTYFDFGRVREESGQFEYKQKWGPLLLDLSSYFLMWNGKEAPVVDPHQAKYRLFVAVWKMLPLWLTKKIGHRLRKGLGI